MTSHAFTVGHLFCGIGGGAVGMAAAAARLGAHSASFRTVGGVDLDPVACRDFERLTGAPATCADVHVMTVAELRAAWGETAPDVVLMSPPCKGFSGLLSAARASEEKYQRLNRLLVDGILLLTSAWSQPPALIFIENVPRIAVRGRHLLEQVRALLASEGYAVTPDGHHDCGELGGLAQHRRRFFLVARHCQRVPQLVYQPPRQRVRACGEVLEHLPIPLVMAGTIVSSTASEGAKTIPGGPLHVLPRISWRNWIRLALIPAGGDWRDLPGVLPPGVKRRERFRRGAVAGWSSPAATVTGPGGSAAEAVADPRVAEAVALGKAGDPDRFGGRPGMMGLIDWQEPAPTVTGGISVLGGSTPRCVADPRGLAVHAGNPNAHRNKFTVASWDAAAATVIGAGRPGSGAPSVADPRPHNGVLGVVDWDEPAGTVTGSGRPQTGKFSVADPRLGCQHRAGAYRVLGWQEAAATTITGALNVDNGAAAVADPRPPASMNGSVCEIGQFSNLDPDKPPPFVPVIIAADGTWHRPLTTLELVALQGFDVELDGQPLTLSGSGHTKWREHIGNAIPPPAALAIAEQLLISLLASALGEWTMGATPVWVAPGVSDEAGA